MTATVLQPLFAHVDAWQWRPDLIRLNNLTVLATPNHYVQQLFSRNRGDQVLPIQVDGGSQTNQFASATRDNATGEVILKVVNAANVVTRATVILDTTGSVADRASAVVLTGSTGEAENSFEQPRVVAPIETKIQNVSRSFEPAFPARSMTVMRLKVK